MHMIHETFFKLKSILKRYGPNCTLVMVNWLKQEKKRGKIQKKIIFEHHQERDKNRKETDNMIIREKIEKNKDIIR